MILGRQKCYSESNARLILCRKPVSVFLADKAISRFLHISKQLESNMFMDMREEPVGFAKQKEDQKN